MKTSFPWFRGDHTHVQHPRYLLPTGGGCFFTAPMKRQWPYPTENKGQRPRDKITAGGGWARTPTRPPGHETSRNRAAGGTEAPDPSLRSKLFILLAEKMFNSDLLPSLSASHFLFFLPFVLSVPKKEWNSEKWSLWRHLLTGQPQANCLTCDLRFPIHKMGKIITAS